MFFAKLFGSVKGEPSPYLSYSVMGSPFRSYRDFPVGKFREAQSKPRAQKFNGITHPFIASRNCATRATRCIYWRRTMYLIASRLSRRFEKLQVRQVVSTSL
jgi:hypothetical protein